MKSKWMIQLPSFNVNNGIQLPSFNVNNGIQLPSFNVNNGISLDNNSWLYLNNTVLSWPEDLNLTAKTCRQV